MSNLFNLLEKIAIVTGGYGHLGTSIVNALVEHGAIVYVAGRSEEKFNAKFNKMKNVYFEECDVLSSKSLCNVFSKINNKHTKIDILVNNAAALKGQNPETISDDEWAYSLDAVLGSVYKGIREVIPYMKLTSGGKIINISSMYGMVSPDFKLYKGEECDKYFNPPHYGAAKAGIIQLTKYYASYLGKYNIHVNAITPGPFPNPSIQKENPVFIERLKERNPLNKIGKPEDLSGICILLASNASDFITGQNFVVDGGWTCI